MECDAPKLMITPIIPSNSESKTGIPDLLTGFCVQSDVFRCKRLRPRYSCPARQLSCKPNSGSPMFGCALAAHVFFRYARANAGRERLCCQC
jgi:hypothetical protein